MKDDKTGGSEDSGQALYAPNASTEDVRSRSHPADQSRDPQADGSSSDGPNDQQTSPVSTDMQRLIGRQLRAVYDDVAKQPVPDRFLELMEQLDRKTAAG